MVGRRVLAFDIGATWMRGAVIDGGTILAYGRVRTPRDPNGRVVARAIIDLAGELLEKAGETVGMVSIASFGPIDYTAGAIVNPPNHPARSIPLRGPLESEMGLPVILANDAVAGAWSGAYEAGVHDLVYVAIGTGVGVGVVVDGRLVLGRRGDSHEAGHIVLDYRSNVRCGCGGRGHWEALYSGRALEEGSPGDSRVVAAGIASLVACYDPEIVLLGGGVVEAGLLGIGEIAGLVREYSFQGRVPRIRVHPLRDKANIYGAYLLAIKPDPGLLALNGW